MFHVWRHTDSMSRFDEIFLMDSANNYHYITSFNSVIFSYFVYFVQLCSLKGKPLNNKKSEGFSKAQ